MLGQVPGTLALNHRGAGGASSAGSGQAPSPHHPQARAPSGHRRPPGRSPVEGEGGSHGQQHEGRHRVAHGQLGGRPGEDVVQQLQRRRGQEVVPEVTPHLQRDRAPGSPPTPPHPSQGAGYPPPLLRGRDTPSTSLWGAGCPPQPLGGRDAALTPWAASNGDTHAEKRRAGSRSRRPCASVGKGHPRGGAPAMFLQALAVLKLKMFLS